MVCIVQVLLMGSLFLAAAADVVDTSCGAHSEKACAEQFLADDDATSLLHLGADINRYGINASTSDGDQVDEAIGPCGSYKCNPRNCDKQGTSLTGLGDYRNKVSITRADNTKFIQKYALGSTTGCAERYDVPGGVVKMMCWRARKGEAGIVGRVNNEHHKQAITKLAKNGMVTEEQAICLSCYCDEAPGTREDYIVASLKDVGGGGPREKQVFKELGMGGR